MQLLCETSDKHRVAIIHVSLFQKSKYNKYEKVDLQLLEKLPLFSVLFHNTILVVTAINQSVRDITSDPISSLWNKSHVFDYFKFQILTVVNLTLSFYLRHNFIVLTNFYNSLYKVKQHCHFN